ncbi:MAG: amino acid ABC transporter permease [Xenococcaceae cyanobacterium]
MTEEKIPLWRDDRFLRVVGQALVVLILGIVVAYLGSNLIGNFQEKGLKFGFSFLLKDSASFDIGDTPIPYTATDLYSKAILVGLLNSLRVMIGGITLATILGITVGIGRLSSNWLVRQIATFYVETLRNTPLLLQLFFWYNAVFLKFPKIDNPVVIPGQIFLTNQGMDIPWPAGTRQTWLALGFLVLSAILAVIIWRRRIQMMLQEGESGKILQIILIGIAIAAILVLVFGLDWRQPQLNRDVNVIQGGLNLSPEFATLLIGLTVYTAAFIAEVVRAGIQSVDKGQWEAAKALGLNPSLVMQLVIFPQALRVMIPPLTSEFLNLAKNSSLAISIGYSDVYALSQTISNQSGRSVEMLLVVMATYLIINLIISLGMNWFNRLVQLKEK